MSNILRAGAASAMILAVGGSAIAESPEYCHDYAAAAVIAAGQNLAYRCVFGAALGHQFCRALFLVPRRDPS